MCAQRMPIYSLTFEQRSRLAGGRRKYNKARQDARDLRRDRLTWIAYCEDINMFERGAQADMARRLGVSPATICRDVAWLMGHRRPCPTCRTMVDERHLRHAYEVEIASYSRADRRERAAEAGDAA